jgi:hypothetical protein
MRSLRPGQRPHERLGNSALGPIGLLGEMIRRLQADVRSMRDETKLNQKTARTAH